MENGDEKMKKSVIMLSVAALGLGLLAGVAEGGTVSDDFSVAHDYSGGNPSGLDMQYAHKISLVWNPANETYYMFYNAVGNKGRGIGLITSKPLPNR